MDTAVKTDPADAWRQRIAAQQSAGQSIRQWCRVNGCHEHAFYWWRARLGLSPVSKRQGRVVQAEFAEVVVDSGPAVGQAVTLRLRGGVELTLPMMTIPQLGELVRAIEGGK